ncbi:MAG: hypothetical protein KatS3mg025_1713 [Bacteroidia bacterium]|nr:MAG: hypothetical protein KatS3mg025_1713 [Bacteroidia bacterium]
MTEVLVVFIVIGLPILAGIGLAGYKEWLKYKKGQAANKENLKELYIEIENLKKENQKLRNRVENLETIVASVEWEKLIEQGLLLSSSNEAPRGQNLSAEEERRERRREQEG